MKYTLFGFNQREAIVNRLDLVDLALLRWFVDFKDAKKDGKPVMVSKIIGDEKMYWVKYISLIDELPILALKSKDSVYRRFKKLAKAKFLKHETVRENGVYSYYCLGDDYYKLLSDDYEGDVGNNSSDSNPNGTDVNPMDRDKNRGGSDSNPRQTDTNPEHSDEKSEQNTNLLYKSTISISNSKGDAPKTFNKHLDLFQEKICKLRKTTEPKFIDVLNNNDLEFIEMLINYCQEQKAKSYNYFEKVLKGCLERNINTKELFEKDIEEFKTDMEQRKIEALKDKQDPKVSKLGPEEFKEEYEEARVPVDVVDDKENLENIKKFVKPEMNEVSYNTWIKNLRVKKEGNTVIIATENEFVKGIVQKRYESLIINALQESNIDYDFIEYMLLEID